MMKSIAALAAFLALLTGAGFQEFEGDSDKKKQEEGKKEEGKKEDGKKKEEAAKAAVKAYREKRSKAKSEDEVVSSIDPLIEADPHPLVRKELLSILESQVAAPVRTASAKGLEKYKKDPPVCDTLLRVAKTQKDENLRKMCLESFGAIAPYGKSIELQTLFADEVNAVAKEAIEAAESIKSIRMFRPLADLLGELERIREDDGGDRGPGVPGGGSSQGDKEQRKKRKSDLLSPTLKALNALWSKHDGKTSLKTYTDANRAAIDHRAAFKKIQDEEDKADKTP